MKRFAMYWALAGAFVPAAIIVISQLQGGVFKWPYLALLFWPSWIFMGGTYEREFSAFGILVLAISIGINILLYVVVGVALWFSFGRLFK